MDPWLKQALQELSLSHLNLKQCTNMELCGAFEWNTELVLTFPGLWLHWCSKINPSHDSALLILILQHKLNASLFGWVWGGCLLVLRSLKSVKFVSCLYCCMQCPCVAIAITAMWICCCVAPPGHVHYLQAIYISFASDRNTSTTLASGENKLNSLIKHKLCSISTFGTTFQVIIHLP